jgi:hypothetical protein
MGKYLLDVICDARFLRFGLIGLVETLRVCTQGKGHRIDLTVKSCRAKILSASRGLLNINNIEFSD